MIRNINEAFGDSIDFETVGEMADAIRELGRLNPGEGYAVPEDGLQEGRDYIDVSKAASALGRKGGKVGGKAKTPAKAKASAANGKLGGRRREIEGHMVGTNLVVNDDCPYCGAHVETSGDDYSGVWACPECGKAAKVHYV